MPNQRIKITKTLTEDDQGRDYWRKLGYTVEVLTPEEPSHTSVLVAHLGPPNKGTRQLWYWDARPGTWTNGSGMRTWADFITWCDMYEHTYSVCILTPVIP